jgi:hypothetical protein
MRTSVSIIAGLSLFSHSSAFAMCDPKGASAATINVAPNSKKDILNGGGAMEGILFTVCNADGGNIPAVDVIYIDESRKSRIDPGSCASFSVKHIFYVSNSGKVPARITYCVEAIRQHK